MPILLKQNFEELMKHQWANFIDKTQLMGFALKNARNANLPVQKNVTQAPVRTRISITKFDLQSNGFEIWIEFTVPIESGLCVGTHIAFLDFTRGDLKLIETCGVNFETQS